MPVLGLQKSLKQQLAIGIFLLFLILLTFLPRVLALSAHWAADEDLWMQRSRDFFFALESGQFEDTFVAYHPGVTTCWLGSLAIWYTSHRQDVFKGWFRSDQFLSPDMLARIRLPIAVMTGVLVLLAGVLLWRLFGAPLAGVSTLFLAIEPFLLSESRRAHTDVLTALFLFLALLLWLCYLEGETRKPRRDIVLSGICFGFACLTKSHAGAFLLFLPILLVWYAKQRGQSWDYLLLSALLWIAGTVLTVLVVWPYLWTLTLKNMPVFPFLFFGSGALLLWSWKKLSHPISFMFSRTILVLLGGCLLGIGIFSQYAFNEVIAKMYDALRTAHPIPTLFLGNIRYNPGPFYFPMMWFVWTGLLTLPLIGFAIYRTWQVREKAERKFRIVVVLVLFALFYCIGLSCVAKKISRYLVIFLPAVSILTAMGGIQFAQLWKKRQLGYLVLGVLFILQAVPILRLHPNYRAYYYPFLSSKWVAENTSSITGAGLDIAADYLNAKPDAHHLQVQLTLFCKDFAPYFVGDASIYHSPNADYDVEYLRDKQIQGVPVDMHPNPVRISSISQDERGMLRELEHVVTLNGIDYVWIYRVLNSPPTNDISTD